MSRFPSGRCQRQCPRIVLLVRLGLMFLAVGLLEAPVQGQESSELPDKVIISPGGRTSARVTLKGEIVDYTGETLQIRVKLGEPPKVFDTADVVEILTPQVSSHQRGLELFGKREFPAAEKEFLAAYEAEGRIWVRREILAYVVRSALMRGDILSASAKFAMLIRSDSRTLAFPLIPLAWSQLRPDVALRDQGELWLRDPKQPAAIRLMGASILLEDRVLGEQALAALRELAADSDRRVRALAACQQWRVRLGNPKEINLTELKSWELKLDAVPEELRGGPNYLMGRAYVSRREFELGAAHLLWTPLVQPDDHFLSAQATLEAAQALVAIGQLESGATLYEETALRYPTTPAAAVASQELAALHQQSGAQSGAAP